MRSITRVMPSRQPGYHADGGGLWLQVTQAGGKSWIFTYSLRGRSREMGLGSASRTTLAEARDERDKCNRLLRDHLDPIEERKRRRAEVALTDAKSITFAQAAAAYIATHRAGLKSAKHAKQWATTIATYAEPRLGKLNVADIDTGLIRQVLAPIWTVKTETAGRVRGRIESILDWARVSGYRAGENLARWRGNLDKLLPKQSKVRKVKHHAAMSYDALPAFMAELRQKTGSSARARVLHSLRCEDRRSFDGAAVRDRRRRLDRAGRTHEGRGDPSRAIVKASDRGRQRG
jgi:hypothetical protein